MQNLEISKDSFLGKGLTIEKDFLQNVELSFKEQNVEQKIEFLYYVGNCCMCLSFQAEYFPSHEDVLKQVALTEEHFAQEKKLRELGWRANYMMDKRENNDFIIDQSMCLGFQMTLLKRSTTTKKGNSKMFFCFKIYQIQTVLLCFFISVCKLLCSINKKTARNIF